MVDLEINSSQDNSTTSTDSYIFGYHTGRRLCRILFFIFHHSSCLAVFFLISLFSLLQEYIVYNIGIIPSGFYKNFVDKNWDGFVHHSVVTSFFVIAIVVIVSSNQYITNVFYVMCRQVLTCHLQEQYFDSNKFFYVNTFGYELSDNPDQRITQDVDKFCNQFSNILSPLIVSPFIIPYYTYDCYMTTGWIGPAVIIVVFIISAVLNKMLIRPVMNMVIQQEKCEGFFRFKHMHVRTNAESIAFQDGKDAELLQSEYHLNNLINAQQDLFLRQYPLLISVKVFDYISSIISYLILAGPVFSGQYSNLSPSDISAVVSKNAFVSIYLISCFSKLIDLSTAISQIAGLTYRVSELLELIQSPELIPRGILPDKSVEPSTRMKDLVAVKLDNVTFTSPSKGTALVSGLTIDITLGQNLLLTGHSSSGKTSFLRVLKGLWPISSGNIKYNLPFKPSNVYFLSQKPLFTDGTLLHQILYPTHMREFSERKEENMRRISSFIEYVDLEHLVEKIGGYGASLNWNNVLSPGEMQRLSFVRLFYHQPKLAFLDEATSGVALEMEEKLYMKCKELNITVVTVGHRTNLFQYHNVHLHFQGNGHWTLQEIVGDVL